MDIIGRNGNDGEHYEELNDKYEDTSEKVRTLEEKISSIDKYLDKNAPYYGGKASATKSVEDFYGEEKPIPPVTKGFDISEDPTWPPPDDSDDTKTY